MKKNQLEIAAQACIAKSLPFIYVEYRGFKAETIKYTDKKGKAAEFEKVTLACETLGEDSQQLAISRDLTVEEKAIGSANLKSPYKKGDRLFVVIRGYATQFGKAEATAASVEKVEE